MLPGFEAGECVSVYKEIGVVGLRGRLGGVESRLCRWKRGSKGFSGRAICWRMRGVCAGGEAGRHVGTQV